MTDNTNPNSHENNSEPGVSSPGFPTRDASAHPSGYEQFMNQAPQSPNASQPSNGSGYPTYGHPAPNYEQPTYEQQAPGYNQNLYGHTGPAYGTTPQGGMMDRLNKFALVALILGVAQFFVGITSIPAIIFGHLALSQIKKSGEEGKWMAVTGLVLGYAGIAVILLVLGFILLVAIFGSTASSSYSY